MSEPLPPFPTHKPYRIDAEGQLFQDINASRWAALEYERARADAALARLKVAVEAMNEIRSVHPLMHNGGNWDKFVDEKLAAIGPLP